MLLICFGFLISTKRVKKVFVPIFLLFLVPNLFRFSVEVAASHKFFNFFLILGQMLSASVLISTFDFFRKLRHLFLRLLAYLSIGLLVGFLTLSGVIDFFVVANDPNGTLADIGSNPVATWVAKHTPPGAVFLNGSWLYNPA